MTEIIDLTNTSDEEEAMIKPSKAKKVKLDNAETMQDELDLQAALRASLLPSNPSTSLNSTPQNAIAGSSTGTSRLELEEARLERQRERERNGTIIKSNLKPYSAPNATTMGVIGSSVNTSTTSNLTGTQSQASSSNSTSNRYFQGAVRNVYNQWDPSNKAAMTFRDTTGPQNLMTVRNRCDPTEFVADNFSI